MTPTDPAPTQRAPAGRATAPGQADQVDQAAAWVARLRAPDCTPGDRSRFEDWLAHSPGHIEAYLEMERIEAVADELAADALVRAAARKSRRDAAETAPGRRYWRVAVALAATLVLAIGVVLWVLRAQAPQVVQYATAVGAQRTLDLPDGTRVRLDTDSAISTRFDADARRVDLLRGRAQFVVADQPGRPFTVHAGAAMIEDVGTTFQASMLAGQVGVGLLDGAVIVSVASASGRPQRAVLAPGQQVVVDRTGTLQPRQPLDQAIAEAWPRGELVFKRRRLDDLLAEMNRYSATPVTLADPALGAIVVSGVFHIGDQASLVAALEQGWDMRGEQVDGSGVVLRRAGPDAPR